MYRYETHLHTFPVSKCAKATVREQLNFYRNEGFDGVFITNHFLDGNVNVDKTLPYARQLEFYLSDYFEAKKLEEEMGLSVFFGVELSQQRTDFLVYGLDPDWYRRHPEVAVMEKSDLLPYLMEAGALVIHAHPFRVGKGIKVLRLYPWAVHGAEVFNACRTDHENEMAALFVKHYDLIPFAGSDIHAPARMTNLGGMETDSPLIDEKDFVRRVLEKTAVPFSCPVKHREEQPL